MSDSAAPSADPIVAEARAHRDAARWLPSIAQYRRAIERYPNDATLFFELGESYRAAGDFGRAIHAFERAIALDADLLAAYRSGADTALAQMQKVGPSSKAAGDLKKFAAMYLTALGQQQLRRGSGDAEASFREAIALDGKSAAAYGGFGEVLEASGRFGEAEKALRRAIALDPKIASAHVTLGNALQSLGRYKEMEAAYRRALDIDPGLREVRESLLSVPLSHMLYDSEATPAEIYRRHREWGEWLVGEAQEANPIVPPLLMRAIPTGHCASRTFRRISAITRSVSFLSPCLRITTRPLSRPIATPSSRRRISLPRHCSRWAASGAIRMGSPTRLCVHLREDQIDIAIDLAGHTGHSRLSAFAIKPAPVTATWLGYAATTGLPTIDWRITDARADPPGQEQFHTEKLMRLPDSFICYHFYGAENPDVTPPPVLARNSVTFGSFNNPMKLSARTIAAWTRILDAVPNSRLMLKSLLFVDPWRRQTFLERFAAHGISGERLELREPVRDMMDHLRSYREIDIALDPFPYNGTTTTCEAMWMGVPMVSLIGDHHCARVGFDLLSQVGMAELAAPDVDAYIAKATALAKDVPRLVTLRGELRGQMQRSPLCDAPRFARAFEAGLREMWHHWCR